MAFAWICCLLFVYATPSNAQINTVVANSVSQWTSVIGYANEFYYTPIKFVTSVDINYATKQVYFPNKRDCTTADAQLACAQSITCQGYHWQAAPAVCTLYYATSDGATPLFEDDSTFYVHCMDCDVSIDFDFEPTVESLLPYVIFITTNNNGVILSTQFNSQPAVVAHTPSVELNIDVVTPLTLTVALKATGTRILLAAITARTSYILPAAPLEMYQEDGTVLLFVILVLVACFVAAFVYRKYRQRKLN